MSKEFEDSESAHLYNLISSKIPQLRMSIDVYDEFDSYIKTITGTFNEVYDSLSDPAKYYYRAAAFREKTIRERVSGNHFNIKVSCVGGLEFSLSEAVNRYLNYQFLHVEKTFPESFTSTLCKVEWYTKMLHRLSLLTKQRLEEQISIIEQRNNAVKVENLNLYRKKSGIYILVLDKYKTCYIGQTGDITKRILRHWSRTDYFTGTGIDLFKAFDTTRIYVVECDKNSLDKNEYEIVKELDSGYTLNVLSGGTVDYHIENNLSFMKDDSEEYRNHIIKEFDDPIGNAIRLEKIFITE